MFVVYVLRNVRVYAGVGLVVVTRSILERWWGKTIRITGRGKMQPASASVIKHDEGETPVVGFN